MQKVDRAAFINSMREIEIHKLLLHRNIIRLHEIIDDELEDKVYLVMEYADQGPIMQFDADSNEFVHNKGSSSGFIGESKVREYAMM